MSIAGIVLICAWIFDTLYHRDLAVKMSALFQDKAALSIMGIYALHLLAMTYTSDWDYGLKDLRVKLPLLYLPLAVATMRSLNINQRKLILGLHLLAVLVSTSISYSLWTPLDSAMADPRDMVRFVSHIRLSLMIVMCIGLLPVLMDRLNFRSGLFAAAAIAWFVFFLYQLQAMTGLTILLAVLALFFISRLWNKRFKIPSAIALLSLTLLIGGYLFSSYSDYYDTSGAQPSAVGERSAMGGLYSDWTQIPQIEYNRYIWSHYQAKELRESWSASLTALGYEATVEQEGRVIRYLNAMGQTKDAAGVKTLNSQDIEHILAGYTAPPSMRKSGIDQRLNRLFYEWSAYWSGADPSGNSMTQRFEFWRAGIHIIKAYPIFGVGTGDVRDAFETAYLEFDTRLAPESQERTHNQYLTWVIAFGIIGGLLSICLFFYPLFARQGLTSYTLVLFFVVIGMSFLTEDTLETQVGATLYAFYGAMILIGVQTLEREKEEQPTRG